MNILPRSVHNPNAIEKEDHEQVHDLPESVQNLCVYYEPRSQTDSCGPASFARMGRNEAAWLCGETGDRTVDTVLSPKRSAPGADLHLRRIRIREFSSMPHHREFRGAKFEAAWLILLTAAATPGTLRLSAPLPF